MKLIAENISVAKMKDDFRTMFIKNGDLIGITSSGNSFDLVHDNLEALINAGCTICVCECLTFDRKNRGTNAAIDSFPASHKQYIEQPIGVSSAHIDALV